VTKYHLQIRQNLPVTGHGCKLAEHHPNRLCQEPIYNV